MENYTPTRSVSTSTILLAFLAVSMLAFVYVFQRQNFLCLWVDCSRLDGKFFFALNRSIRVLLNDFACLLLIWAMFRNRNHLRIAFLVFLIEFFLILPVYLIIKLSIEGESEISSPLLSQIHRLIVNPTLMLLLIVGFIYQKLGIKSH